MRHFAHLVLALLCATALTSVSAQPLQIAPKLEQRTQMQQKVRLLKLKPLPVYSQAERRAALSKVMSLTTPLGAPFSLTPAKPFIPGVAALWLNKVDSVGATFAYPEGGATFSDDVNAKLNIQMIAQPGKKYAVDCRISNAGKVYYSVIASKNTNGYTSQPYHAENELTPDSNSHFVFATGTMPANDSVWITLSFKFPGYVPQLYDVTLWGCEISPF